MRMLTGTTELLLIQTKRRGECFEASVNEIRQAAEFVYIAWCRRKSLRLQKLSQDRLDTDAEPGPIVEDMAGDCAAEAEEDVVADEGDDFFSPFPDPDLLSQVENDQGATVVAAMTTTSKTDFQAARRRHSVMPARHSDPPLLPTTSSESSEAEPEPEQTRKEEISTRKPAGRTKPRASTRRAPSRASTRRKTR